MIVIFCLVLVDGPYNIKLTPSGDVTKIENDSLTLTCAANCNPEYHYNWSLRDGEQVLAGDKLEFVPVRREDQGHYRCRASNGIGSDQDKDITIPVNCKYIHLCT